MIVKFRSDMKPSAGRQTHHHRYNACGKRPIFILQSNNTMQCQQEVQYRSFVRWNICEDKTNCLLYHVLSAANKRGPIRSNSNARIEISLLCFTIILLGTPQLIAPSNNARKHEAIKTYALEGIVSRRFGPSVQTQTHHRHRNISVDSKSKKEFDDISMDHTRCDKHVQSHRTYANHCHRCYFANKCKSDYHMP